MDSIATKVKMENTVCKIVSSRKEYIFECLLRAFVKNQE